MNQDLLTHYETAKKYKLPVTYLKDLECLRIELGQVNYYFKDNITPINNETSAHVAKHKYALFTLLGQAGFPVPKQRLVDKATKWHDTLPNEVKKLKFPVALRPISNTRQTQALIGPINTLDELVCQIERAFEDIHFVLIHEYPQGPKKYDVLIFNDQIIRVIERLSTSCIPLNHPIDPYNEHMIKAAANTLGLNFVEFSLCCNDINHPFLRSQWTILDANCKPAIALHNCPDSSITIKLSQNIMKQLIFKHPWAYVMHRLRLIFNLCELKNYGT